MTQETIIQSPSPRLNKLERLYVKVYLRTLSHTRAHEAVSPGIKNPKADNPYSSRENVQFYISEGLEEKAEAVELTSDKIIERLYKEAIREGAGSNHSARIQALVQLGKHLGLFQEKKEVQLPTFQIINYGTKEEPTIPTELEEQIESIKEETKDLNIKITEYS